MTEDQPQDKTVEEIIPLANEMIDQGFDIYIKWTCPHCGDRATVNEPNTIYAGGYYHEECGGYYDGSWIGFMAVGKMRE